MKNLCQEIVFKKTTNKQTPQSVFNVRRKLRRGIEYKGRQFLALQVAELGSTSGITYGLQE